ncbi:MAG: methyltransferase domain-containing protein [Nitrospinae bacterium]|nr:methyltransferase domain-containing protein [Nitrospinota bacterium]
MTDRTPQGLEKDHNQTIREEFTRQATAYAANASLHDPARIARLVQAVQPAPEQRVLEVATGPGHVAMAFAAIARAVVGVDLTEAPLAIAERRRQDLGLHNVSFRIADASHLPLANSEFDIVVCRFAFHHFTDAPHMLGEMVRVCARQGTLAVEDLIVSEHPARAAYQNCFENLRDPSHVAAFSLRTLLTFFAKAGLEIEHVATDHLTQSVERWLTNAQTPADRATEVRDLIEQDAREDLSGVRPFRTADGQWWFRQRTVILVGRKLRP